MFERFSTPARDVVIGAVTSAQSEGAEQVREEHLLSALIGSPTGATLAARAGLDAQTGQTVLSEIRTARRRGGLSAVDAASLSSLGIDLDAVLDKVASSLGASAADSNDDGGGGRGGGGKARPWRIGGRLPVSAGVKLVLQAALRQAVAAGDREIGERQLLLGLLAARGLVADTLARHGVTLASALAA